MYTDHCQTPRARKPETWHVVLCSWIRRRPARWQCFRSLCIFNRTAIRMPASCSRTLGTVRKSHLRIAERILRENEAGELMLVIPKTYCKAELRETTRNWHKGDQPNRNQDPEMNQHVHVSLPSFWVLEAECRTLWILDTLNHWTPTAVHDNWFLMRVPRQNSGRSRFFSQGIILRQLYINHRRPICIPQRKYNSKWIKDLNV